MINILSDEEASSSEANFVIKGLRETIDEVKILNCGGSKEGREQNESIKGELKGLLKLMC